MSNAAAEEAIVGLLSDPEMRANPYPAYDTIRSSAPVFHSSLEFWFVSSYAESARLMRTLERIPFRWIRNAL